MRKITLLLLLVVTSFNLAAQLPSFPGAEGHGRYTVGGRGGEVYRVTTLEDSDDPGTLRYAVSQRGKRTIVFDVAGTIFLKKELKIIYDNITIAGQSAPGQGICIADYGVTIAANDVIIRYIRFRPGSKSAIEEDLEPDGLGGMDRKNIIIDHCSISWSVDECLSVYGCENTTVQWSIISESLRNSGHSKGKHGYGGNWGGKKATYHHNLLAHHDSRVPRLGPRAGTQESEYADIRNNVMYNWAGNGCYGGEGMKVNIVNNYYKPGPATPDKQVRYRIAKIGIRTESYINTYPAFAPMKHVWGKYYVDGNVIEGNTEVTNDNWTKGIYEQINNSECDGLYTSVTKDTIKLHEPLKTNAITTHTAAMAYTQVLKYVGCSLDRDIIDERLINETQNGTATYTGSIDSSSPGLIDRPSDVMPAGATSPWPELSNRGVTAEDLKDSDGDGMPDKWEIAMGLNPEDASDGKSTSLSTEGYTNLEVYLNSLVADITNNQNGGIEISGDAGLEEEKNESLEVEVTPSTLVSKFDAAESGSVLILTSGEYTQRISIPTNKEITLKAAEGANVVLKFAGEIIGSSSSEGSTLIFDGLTIDPSGANYFINLNNGAYLKSLQFKNCDISSSGRGLMTISDEAINGELIIDNCIFELSGCSSYSYIYNNGGATQKVSITRSTFYNYPQEHLFWIRRYGKAVDFKFIFEQNTIYKWGKSGKEYCICKIEEPTFTAESEYIFKDNIVNNGYESSSTIVMLNTTGAGKLIAQNNLLVGIGGYTAKNITESSINDLTLGEGTLANLSTIGFSNPDQGEFYIDETSPITIAGTNGRGLGDPRWLPAGNNTGIEDNFTSENAIWAYASNGVIYLKGVVSGSFIEVYTYNGTCIANQLASDNEISIYAPKGNYIIRVTHNDTVSTYKVMNF